jgi:hypothetical protein
MKIKNVLKSIWELPQNALGYIVLKVTKAKYYCQCRDSNVYSWKLGGGLSLGKYIFIPFAVDTRRHSAVVQYIKHEYGHSIQSKYLGWFYLLVIGLPSLIWNKCGGKYREKHKKSYYDFYTEKWADKLGGVERKGNE